MKVTVVTTTSITIEWQAAKSATQYSIRAVQDNPSSIVTINDSTSATSFVIMNLNPGHVYQVFITAISDVGMSEESDGLSQITGMNHSLQLTTENGFLSNDTP